MHHPRFLPDSFELRQRRAPIFLVIVSVITCLGSSGCAGSQRAQMHDDVPPDFVIVLGQGGGFSGMWEGHSVRADGTVTAWRGLDREDERHLGTLSAQQLENIWQRLNHDDLLDRSLAETGNLTSFLEVTAGGSTRRLTWASGADTDDATVAAAESAFQEIRRMVTAGTER